LNPDSSYIVHALLTAGQQTLEPYMDESEEDEKFGGSKKKKIKSTKKRGRPATKRDTKEPEQLPAQGREATTTKEGSGHAFVMHPGDHYNTEHQATADNVVGFPEPESQGESQGAGVEPAAKKTKEEQEQHAPQEPQEAGGLRMKEQDGEEDTTEKHVIGDVAEGAAAELEPQTEEASVPAPAREQPEMEKENTPSTVEHGLVYFFYRPKVGIEEAECLADVQRFYMILAPADGQCRARLALVGKKRLPSIAARHERFFGFIAAVGDSVEELSKELGPKEYDTKTLGRRTVAAARAVGAGAYAIVIRDGAASSPGQRRTDLQFHLDVPAVPGEVQHDFSLPEKGSYVFSIKNPAAAAAAAANKNIGGEDRHETSPLGMQGEPARYAWIGVTDPSCLNHERCEFLLVAASEGRPAAESGTREGGSQLTGTASDQLDMHYSCEGADAVEERILEELKKAEEVGIETAPIESGQWA